MKKSLLLISILLLLISNIYAQNIGFSGIVTGKDNTPLKEAVIIIADAVKSTALYTTITDSLGRYTVPKSPDKFILNISHIGFRSTTNTISLSDYTNRVVGTSMEPLALDMKEVTVYGATPQVKRDGGKFVVENVSNYTFAKGNNAQTLLRYIPMLDVNPEGKISILGRETSNIQINGREMPGMNITEALKSIPASDIDKIEIVAIAGSAYKAGTGSVLNIILKKRPNEGVRVNVSIGDSQSYFNNQNGSAYLSYANQKVNITSGASVNNTGYMSKANEMYNYYKNDLNTDIYAENGLRNLTLSGFFNMDYTINEKQVIGARLFVNSRDSKNNDDSQSTYRNISSGTVDSIYNSFGQTLSPYWNTNWGANVNYNLKTSDSGSEKQRIYIARAVYRDPEFILFDEATSSLDSNNERAIMEGIEQFRKNKTVVIIAHRLSTIKNADNIVFLDNGKIIEEGTHEQLLERKGAYYHLVKNQLELSKS